MVGTFLITVETAGLAALPVLSSVKYTSEIGPRLLMLLSNKAIKWMTPVTFHVQVSYYIHAGDVS